MRKVFWFAFILPLFLHAAELISEKAAEEKGKFHDHNFAYYMKDFIEYESRFRYKGADGVDFSLSYSNNLESDRHILIGCMMHVDEFGCLPAILDIFEAFLPEDQRRKRKLQPDAEKEASDNRIKELEKKLNGYSGRITFFMGNPLALTSRAPVGMDINRAFGDKIEEGDEKTRAESLKLLLGEAKLFVDLYQTREASEPENADNPTDRSFYVFPFEELIYEWARYLQVSRTVFTYPPNEVFKTNAMSMVEYARKHSVPALSVEISKKGFSELAYQRTIKVVEMAARALTRLSDSSRLTEIRQLADGAKAPELKLYSRKEAVDFSSPRMKLNPGFKNFSSVKKDQVLGSDAEDSPLKASADGYVLYPKYPPRDADGKVTNLLPLQNLYLLIQEAKLEDLLKSQ